MFLNAYIHGQLMGVERLFFFSFPFSLVPNNPSFARWAWVLLVPHLLVKHHLPCHILIYRNVCIHGYWRGVNKFCSFTCRYRKSLHVATHIVLSYCFHYSSIIVSKNMCGDVSRCTIQESWLDNVHFSPCPSLWVLKFFKPCR